MQRYPTGTTDSFSIKQPKLKAKMPRFAIGLAVLDDLHGNENVFDEILHMSRQLIIISEWERYEEYCSIFDRALAANGSVEVSLNEHEDYPSFNLMEGLDCRLGHVPNSYTFCQKCFSRAKQDYIHDYVNWFKVEMEYKKLEAKFDYPGPPRTLLNELLSRVPLVH